MSEFELENFTPQDILALMNVYLTEWMHRDEILWKQVFKFFYATLVVLFLPNLAGFLGLSLPKLPAVLFPIIAFFLAFVFLYVSIGYTKRLEAIGKTYKRIMEFLPEELRRISIYNPEIKHGKFFGSPMSTIICFIMFTGLILLSVIMAIYHLV